MAIAFHPELEYGAYEVEGRLVIVAEGLAVRVAEAIGKPFGLPVIRMKGEHLEDIVFTHPLYSRPSRGVLAWRYVAEVTMMRWSFLREIAVDL